MSDHHDAGGADRVGGHGDRPARFAYPCGVATGFDVLAAERVASGGLLIARGATHFAAEPALEADPAVVEDLDSRLRRSPGLTTTSTGCSLPTVRTPPT